MRHYCDTPGDHIHFNGEPILASSIEPNGGAFYALGINYYYGDRMPEANER